MVYCFYDIATNEQTKCSKTDFDFRVKALKTNEVLFFDSEDFHLYHSKNADEVYFLGFLKESKAIGYCIFGLRDYSGRAMLCMPYSSPFSTFYFNPKIDDLDKARCINSLKSMAKELDADVKLILAPDIYDETLAISMGLVLDEGFKLQYSHVNNYYNLKEITDIDEFVSERAHSFRKNLNKAMRSNLVSRLNDDSSLQNAYQVIKLNRAEKGYPLAMSYQQILDISIMDKSKVDAFVVSNEQTDIAAAIVFEISSNAVQVVYWGALDEYSNLRPMEFLAMNVVKYYKEKGYDYVDIGPSTADEKISHGLLRFKKTIGCHTNFKPVFLWQTRGSYDSD